MATREIDIAPETDRVKRTVATLELMEKGEGERSMVVVIEAAEKANCDFTEVTEEENGAVKFECNMCKKRFAQARGVKQHITSAHLRKEVKVAGLGKRKSVAEFDDDDDAKKARMAAEAGFSKSLMDRWDNSELVCSTQVGLDDLYKEYVENEDEVDMDEGDDDKVEPPAENNTVGEVATQNNASDERVELDKSKAEIRNLKEQLENKETTIGEMGQELNKFKESIKTKDDIINWNLGRVNELEGSLMAKNRETEKQMKVLNNMNAQIKARQETADVKKHKKEISAKNKEIKDMNNRLAEALKSTRDEKSMRAKAEADLLTIRTVNESMKAVMLVQQQQWSANQGAEVHHPTSQHINRTVQQAGTRTEDVRGPGRKQTLCRDLGKPGGCRYKERCQFFHPPGSNETFSQPSQWGKPDCSYWMDGHCKMPEERCKGKHDPTKFKTKPRVEKLVGPIVNHQDFVQTLVGALSQAMTGVQQQVPASMARSPQPARGQKQPGDPAFTLQQQGQCSGAPVLGQQQPGVPAFRQQQQMNAALGQQFPQMGQQMIQQTMMPTLPGMFYPTQQQQQQWGGQSSSNQ